MNKGMEKGTGKGKRAGHMPRECQHGMWEPVHTEALLATGKGLEDARRWCGACGRGGDDSHRHQCTYRGGACPGVGTRLQQPLEQFHVALDAAVVQGGVPSQVSHVQGGALGKQKPGGQTAK